MTFKSKRTLAALITGVGLGVGYTLYALGKHAPAAGDIRAWALAILVFIGIAVAAMVVLHILFHIGYSIGVAVTERQRDDREVERIIASEVTEDELDRLVGLKSSRASAICTGAGLMAALVWFAFFGTSAVVALHLIVGATFVGTWIEGCISIYFYERGV